MENHAKTRTPFNPPTQPNGQTVKAAKADNQPANPTSHPVILFSFFDWPNGGKIGPGQENIIGAAPARNR